jgi:hypothetical protein
MGYKEEDIQAAVNEATATRGLQDSDIWGFVLGILSRGGGSHAGAKEKAAAAADVPVSQPTVQPSVDRGNQIRPFFLLIPWLHFTKQNMYLICFSFTYMSGRDRTNKQLLVPLRSSSHCGGNCSFH